MVNESETSTAKKFNDSAIDQNASGIILKVVPIVMF